MKKFVFNGERSDDFGLHIDEPKIYDTQGRRYDFTAVPARHGEYIQGDATYNTVSASYPVSIVAQCRDDLTKKIEAVREWLNDSKGYCRLEDDYAIDEYRMAVYADATQWEVLYGQYAKSNIVFRCMPQRWLKSGERAVHITGTGTTPLVNPTRSTAHPIIMVKGTGSVIVGDATIKVNRNTGTITIDCERMTIRDANGGDVDSNVEVSCRGTKHIFPSLPRGTTEVSYNGAISSVVVIPRWWHA